MDLEAGDSGSSRMQSAIAALLKIASDAVIAVDANYRITLFNDGAERIFGYARAEVIGRPLDVLLPERFRASHGRMMSALESEGSISRLMGERREIAGLRKDGSEFPAEASIAMVEGEKGRVKSFLAVLRDITERRRTQMILANHARELEQRVKERTSELEAEIRRREEAQAQLVQSQRMEAFGQLTGGVAHDFNNLLTIISGNLELLGPELATDKARGLAKRANEASEMAARLTARLLTFARRRRLEPRVLDLNELILGMSEIVQRTIGAHISVSTILASDLRLTRSDPSEVENALLNLVINARDAMPKGGRIVMETRNAEFSEGDATALGEMRTGQYVVASVTDTGTGMPPEIAKRAFEPFFTTKPTGRGTGLGLSTIYGFAKQSGGHLTLYSEVGHGTTVSLYLPRDVNAEMVEVKPSDGEVPMAENSETVLVVEDNAEVREVTLQRIEGLGYVVVEAGNAREALDILATRTDIDLVFSDVVMPGGMSGFDLARWVSEHRPALPIVLTTGFAQGASNEGIKLAHPILHKPHSRNELAQALATALAQKPSG